MNVNACLFTCSIIIDYVTRRGDRCYQGALCGPWCVAFRPHTPATHGERVVELVAGLISSPLSVKPRDTLVFGLNSVALINSQFTSVWNRR